MKDEHETEEHLMNELVEMRQRVAELEAADTERKRAEEKLAVLGKMAASVSHELRRVLRADHVL